VQRVIDLALDEQVLRLVERESLLAYRCRARLSHVIEIIAA